MQRRKLIKYRRPSTLALLRLLLGRQGKVRLQDVLLGDAAPLAHAVEDAARAVEVDWSCEEGPGSGRGAREKRGNTRNALSNSATAPASITRTRSESMMVRKRCAMTRSYRERPVSKDSIRERGKLAHRLVLELAADGRLDARVGRKVNRGRRLAVKVASVSPGKESKRSGKTHSSTMIFEFLTSALASETRLRSPTDRFCPSSSMARSSVKRLAVGVDEVDGSADLSPAPAGGGGWSRSTSHARLSASYNSASSCSPNGSRLVLRAGGVNFENRGRPGGSA